MVKAIDNRVTVSAELKSVKADPARPGFVVAEVVVKNLDAVEGYPNLLSETMGRTVEVRAPADSSFAKSAPGPVKFKASMEGPGVVMVRPD